MSDQAKCGICGEPMPEGEQMFKYHGFSGPCPKPAPLKAKLEVFIEYIKCDQADGELWIDINVNSQPYNRLGPFLTPQERQRTLNDLLGMMRQLGAKDGPGATQ